MTAPWASDSGEIIAQSHGQVWSVVATHPDLAAPVPLSVESISVTWDESRAPRVQANITATLTDEAESLDPRTGARVDIQAGYVRPGGSQDVHLLADLGIRSVAPDYENGTVQVRATSDEDLLIDGAPAVVASATGGTHAAAIESILAQVLSPLPDFQASVTGGAVTLDPIPDRWSAVQDLADRLGAKVYDNGLRTWHLAPSPTVASTPVHALTVGESGTVLRANPSLDRDSWHNYVTLRYKWRDSADVDQQILATAAITSGPYRIDGPAGKRIMLDERDVQTTQAEANAAAGAVLSRAQSRARSLRLSAISAYWVRPGDTVTVTLPGKAAEAQLVASVTFGGDGTMDLETRIPDPTPVERETTTPPSLPPEEDPPPPATSTYVSTWTANAARTFKQGGAQNTFGDAGTGVDVVQGYYDGTNGNQQGIVLFTASNSTGSESGVSITSALSGASIAKVEVYLYANHWYSSSGGTARIGKYGGTSLPASYSGAAPYVTVSGWARNSGRWVNITSAALIAELKSGFCRGVTVGPGAGTSRTYYGTFNGSAASSGKPMLRITYSK